MRIDEIEKLITKFYEGETSLTEEQELHNYFMSKDVPECLFTDKQLFLTLYDESCQPKVPKELKSKLSALIDSWEEAEENNHFGSRNRRMLIPWISSIAACAVLVFGIWTYMNGTRSDVEKPMIADTYTNSDEACKEVQKALLLVSINLNKGIEGVASAQKQTKIINKIFTNKVNE